MTASSYENAPDEIKLAVDLIYLLESNNIDVNVALKALAIVTKDMQEKSNTKRSTKNS